MIISVPHSGTRSLREYLGEDGYWHFGQNDADIRAFRGHADIPIRDPLDIAVSWDARFPSDRLKTPQNLLWRLEAMFDLIARYSDTALWKVEDLPRLEESRGPDADVRRTRDGPMANALREWMTPPRVTFYNRFYDLEWL